MSAGGYALFYRLPRIHPCSMSVMSVTGEVDMAGGGGGGGGEGSVFCLSNEHLFIDQTSIVKLLQGTRDFPSDLLHAPLALENRGRIMQNPLSNLDNVVLNKPAMAEQEVRSFKAAGGTLVVDTTVPGLDLRSSLCTLTSIQRSVGIRRC